MRTRPADAALAIVATLSAVLGLTTLTTSASWLGLAFWSCLAVALLGVGLRRLTHRASLVLLGQVVVGGWFVLLVAAPGALTYGVPGPGTVQRLVDLGADIANVVTKYASPIPTTVGITFLLVGAVAALAVVVDFLAVTRNAPAAAGLPLLGAFLTAVANSGSSLSPGFFLVAAVAWLLLISRTTSSAVRRWSTTTAASRTTTTAEDAEAGAVSGMGSSARRLGVAAVLLAVLLPAVLPHLPTRFVLDGLGRNDSAVGNGGRVGFNSTLDLTRSLQSGSLNTVLTYRTSTTGTPPPLRVVVASDYVDGQWRTGRTDTFTGRALTATSHIAASVATQQRTVTINDNTLDAPHAASPQPVTAASFGSTSWSTNPDTGDLYVRSRPDSYSLTYAEVDVTGEQLRAGIDGGDPGDSDPLVPGSRDLDSGSATVVRALATQVVGSAATSYDKAVAIQNYLRGSDFTYSLTLLPDAQDAQGRRITDPIVNFLTTKQGYCVQFASAMIMMARAEGIPARMAIGFLPGSLDNGTYTVRAADAHAWPELYFAGAGWLRFEPTPATRTGSAPDYTAITTTPGGTATTAPTSQATPTASASSINPQANKPDSETSSSSVGSVPLSDRIRAVVSSPTNLVLLAIVLGLLGSLVLPVTARLVHRRRRARAVSAPDLAEAQWDELVSRLGDLGLHPPTGGTLREWRSHFVREGYLDEEADASMGRVVATLERTRYARPARRAVDVRAEIDQIARSVSQNRPPRQRLHAFFVPDAGVRWWSRRWSRVTGAPTRFWRAVAAHLPRRS